jgi:Putative restriction endonuclease
VKWHRYAAAGIPAYWIVNLLKRQIEVFGNPAERGMAASYRDAASYGPEAVLPVVIDGREVGRFVVRDLFP